MTTSQDYDVFLCHNSKEKQQVERIRKQLKQQGILAWLDKYDFEPFRPWQDQLEEIIPQIKAVAVFIGSSGVGPWANIEMREFLVEFANRQLRMGLVILPGCTQELIDSVPRFIKSFHWVDFRQQEPDPMEQLIWGISGKKPAPTVKVIPQSQTQNTQQNQRDDSGDDLSSESGVDYRRLRDLLKTGEWKQADQETLTVMLRMAGKEQERWLRKEDIESFPSTDLRTIDSLWVKYSRGHFGFSVQKRIWQSVGGNPGVFNEETWFSFGERVGWRTTRHHQIFLVTWTSREWSYYSQINFNLDAPEGHLPRMWDEWRGGVEVSSIALRLVRGVD